jgi:LDH2 family malate/lactate/ureidoglycolate dehydrogenase
MSPIHFMIAAFSLYVDFWCGVGFMHSKVAQDQPLVNMFMFWSVDISSSLVNWGNIYLARLKGEQIPPGVAIDADGKITSDPYKAGGMLPFAGHKGSGLAMVIELLAGALTGSRVGYAVPGGWGILFIILDPQIFRPLVEFKNDAMICIDELKKAKKADNVHHVFFPGEHSAERRAASIRQGVVEVDASIYHLIFKSD